MVYNCAEKQVQRQHTPLHTPFTLRFGFASGTFISAAALLHTTPPPNDGPTASGVTNALNTWLDFGRQLLPRNHRLTRLAYAFAPNQTVLYELSLALGFLEGLEGVNRPPMMKGRARRMRC